uniref:Uncharacterized protein n=1 Tax=Gopherus agassizii TaxID=38772 RepID=A0A452GN26_9SAUR
MPEVSNFHIVVGKIQEVPFGLSTNPEVLSHYNITSNTISIFRVVDDKRQDLELTDGKKTDAAKMSRFIQINELRMVTEYNPVVTKDPPHSWAEHERMGTELVSRQTW